MLTLALIQNVLVCKCEFEFNVLFICRFENVDPPKSRKDPTGNSLIGEYKFNKSTLIDDC